jgi:hypothetical protein
LLGHYVARSSSNPGQGDSKAVVSEGEINLDDVAGERPEDDTGPDESDMPQLSAAAAPVLDATSDAHPTSESGSTGVSSLETETVVGQDVVAEKAVDSNSSLETDTEASIVKNVQPDDAATEQPEIDSSPAHAETAVESNATSMTVEAEEPRASEATKSSVVSTEGDKAVLITNVATNLESLAEGSDQQASLASSDDTRTAERVKHQNPATTTTTETPKLASKENKTPILDTTCFVSSEAVPPKGVKPLKVRICEFSINTSKE